MSQQTVESLMSRKVLKVRPSDTVEHARVLMAQGHIRHLPVVTSAGTLLGIVSDRDLLAAVGRDTDPLSTVMTADPLTVFTETPAYEAAALMIHHRFNALPVVDADMRVLGIITGADLLAAAHSALQAPVVNEPAAAETSRSVGPPGGGTK